MNHVQNIGVWHSKRGRTLLIIEHEQGDMKRRAISDCKAASIGCLVMDFVRRNKLRVYPIVIEGWFGWTAERISPRP